MNTALGPEGFTSATKKIVSANPCTFAEPFTIRHLAHNFIFVKDFLCAGVCHDRWRAHIMGTRILQLMEEYFSEEFELVRQDSLAAFGRI